MNHILSVSADPVNLERLPGTIGALTFDSIGRRWIYRPVSSVPPVIGRTLYRLYLTLFWVPESWGALVGKRWVASCERDMIPILKALRTGRRP
jgi:hypothetical protein